MTAIIILRYGNGIGIYSDGAAYDADQVMGQVHAKVDCLPHLPAVVAYRGSAGGDLAFSFVSKGKYQTFDQLVAGIEADMQAIAALQYSHVRTVNCAFFLGGFSTERNQWEAYSIWANGRSPRRLASGACTLEFIDGLIASPDLSQAEWDRLAPPDQPFYPTEENMVEVMETLRRTKHPSGSTADSKEAYIIGAFIQFTFLDENGISTRIVRRWPDPVGEKIDPFREVADDGAEAA